VSSVPVWTTTDIATTAAIKRSRHLYAKNACDPNPILLLRKEKGAVVCSSQVLAAPISSPSTKFMHLLNLMPLLHNSQGSRIYLGFIRVLILLFLCSRDGEIEIFQRILITILLTITATYVHLLIVLWLVCKPTAMIIMLYIS
jgi:hypothetical protein